MDFTNLARNDIKNGIGRQSSKKADSYIEKWNKFCDDTGIQDRFLSDKSKSQKTEILCTFAAAI